MAFLKINNVTIPVEEGSSNIAFDDDVSYQRSNFGELTTSRKFRRLVISGNTTPLTMEEANAVEGLLSGEGNLWRFRDDVGSAFKGNTPRSQATCWRAAIDKSIGGYSQGATGEGGIFRMLQSTSETVSFHVNLPTDDVGYTVGVGHLRHDQLNNFYRRGLIFQGNYNSTSTVPAADQRIASATAVMGAWTLANSTTHYNFFDIEQSGFEMRLRSTNAFYTCFFDMFALPYKLTSTMLDEYLSTRNDLVPPPYVGVSGDMVSDFIYPDPATLGEFGELQKGFILCKPRMTSRNVLQGNKNGFKNNLSRIGFELVEQPANIDGTGHEGGLI